MPMATTFKASTKIIFVLCVLTMAATVLYVRTYHLTFPVFTVTVLVLSVAFVL